MQIKGSYEFIPTTYIDEDKEEGKYTTIYTDVGNFEILKPLELVRLEILEAKEKKQMFTFKKLEEFSQVLKHYGELFLDVSKVKILGYKEHTIEYNKKKAKELNLDNNL